MGHLAGVKTDVWFAFKGIIKEETLERSFLSRDTVAHHPSGLPLLPLPVLTDAGGETLSPPLTHPLPQELRGAYSPWEAPVAHRSLSSCPLNNGRFGGWKALSWWQSTLTMITFTFSHFADGESEALTPSVV